MMYLYYCILYVSRHSIFCSVGKLGRSRNPQRLCADMGRSRREEANQPGRTLGACRFVLMLYFMIICENWSVTWFAMLFSQELWRGMVSSCPRAAGTGWSCRGMSGRRQLLRGGCRATGRKSVASSGPPTTSISPQEATTTRWGWWGQLYRKHHAVPGIIECSGALCSCWCGTARALCLCSSTASI